MIFLSVTVRDSVAESISYSDEKRHIIFPQPQGTAPKRQAGCIMLH